MNLRIIKKNGVIKNAGPPNKSNNETDNSILFEYIIPKGITIFDSSILPEKLQIRYD